MSGFTEPNDRPMTVLTAVGLSLCMLLSAAVCFMGCGRLGVYTTTYMDTFDTVLTVTVGAPTREQATEWTTDLHAIAKALHTEFSAYDDSDGLTNVRVINAHAGEDTPLAVSDDLLDLLQMGRELHEKTNGQLNICLGSLTSLWHKARTEGKYIPDEAALEDARRHCDITALEIDPAAKTVRLTKEGTSLDVGAIAKGYALEKMRLYAEEAGITALLINFGGQVMAIGRHPDGDPWSVAIRDPRDGSVLETVELEDAILATSADDQRTFTVDGVAYHHLIDPQTAYPARLFRSVTVILPLKHTAISDGLSTALFLLPRGDGEVLLAEYGGGALWMDGEGNVDSHNWTP